jgi:hypothetical protein
MWRPTAAVRRFESPAGLRANPLIRLEIRESGTTVPTWHRRC